ncbi:hypothetical protein QEN19_002456 [Hanseniaspora menglaensis]
MSDLRPTKRRALNKEQSSGNESCLNPEDHLLQRTLSNLPSAATEDVRSLNDNLSSVGMRTRQSVAIGYNRGGDIDSFYQNQKAQMPNQPKILDNSQFTLPSYKRTLPPDEFQPVEYRRVQTDIPGGFNQFQQHIQQQQIQQQYLQQQLQYQKNNQQYQTFSRQTFERPSMNINTGMLLNHTRSEFPHQQAYTSGIPGLEYSRTKSSLYETEIDLERRLSEIDENKDKIEQISKAINTNPDDMEF